MRKIRDVLRLRAGGMSKRKIAASLSIGVTAAGDCMRRARRAGLIWPLPQDLSDAALELRLFGVRVRSPIIACTYLHPQPGRQVLRLGGRNKRGSQDRSRSAISDVRLSLDRCVRREGDRGNGRLGQVQALARAEFKRTVLR